MNVLHVVNDYSSQISGYSIRTRYIICNQRALGLQPIVIVSPYHNYMDNNVERIGKVIIVDGVQYHFTGMPGRIARNLINFSPWVYRRIEMFFLESYIRTVVANSKKTIDLIHAHSPFMVGWPAARAASRLRVPFVYEVRGLWEETSITKGHFSNRSLRYRYSKHKETDLALQADGVVVISEALRAEFTSRGVIDGKIIVVPNGVDPEKFTVRSDGKRVREELSLTKKTVVGYLGSISSYECLEDAILATAVVNEVGIDMDLLIVGDGPSRASLEHVAKVLNVENCVHFLSFVPHDQIPSYYEAIDIFLLPRCAKNIAAVMPLKPLESLAMGRAVVSSDFPAIREIICDGQTGLLYRVGDRAGLVKALIKLIRQPGLGLSLGSKGRKWVLENRTWRYLVSRYLAFYEQLTAKQHHQTRHQEQLTPFTS
jgi:glycosyltransferase involved in cell wall biosynthesis